LVREAEEKLVDWTHPDPWVNPYMPGGSRFMRNPALPLSIVFPPDLFPEGVPPEYNIASQVRARRRLAAAACHGGGCGCPRRHAHAPIRSHPAAVSPSVPTRAAVRRT